MNFIKIALAATTLAVASQSAYATVASGINFIDLTGSEPVSTPGVFENDTAGFGWNELTDITLGSLISAVDTNYGVTASTLIDSHLIGFDPTIKTSVTFSVTFYQPIQGVIWTTAGLNATNAALGLPTVTYNTARYLGLEPMDSFMVSGNTLNFTAYSIRPGDFMRVLTAAGSVSPVPEPSLFSMMGLGLAGVAFAVSRKRRIS